METAEQKKLLEKMSKKDLIEVIAYMQDTVMGWTGRGLHKEVEELLRKVGWSCCSYLSGEFELDD